MQRTLTLALAAVLALGVAFATGVPAVSKPQPRPSPSPKPTATLAYPVIVRTVSRPFCRALGTTIAPIVGQILQNKTTIAKADPLFAQYQRYEEQLANTSETSALRDILLERMENLVQPLVDSFKIIDKHLNNTHVFHYPPKTDDDRRLLALRDDLQKTVDYQKSSLDVINGFVQTEQLSEMQHEGLDQAQQMSRPEVAQTPVVPTANPLLSNKYQAGLPPDPHSIDYSEIPGLSVGSNPISRVHDGLTWTENGEATSEKPATQQILAAVQECRATPAPPASHAP